MANLLYHVSAAQYYDACEAVLDRTPDFFVFVCVESEPPHGVACYELQPRDILVGERLMNIARERYRDARKSGRWIGYPETVEAITLPRWAVTFEE